MISENRKASYKYEVMEHLECGMVLMGSEVKAMREGRVSLEEAYGRVRNGELWLINSDISEYRQATRWNHSPKRPRKLLVHRRQYEQLSRRAHERGLTLIPLKLYFNPRGIAKLLLGICRGKRVHDKRESLKEADAKRRIDRSLRRGRS
ncbi:MAG: SsrA-binding protein SmpB [Planctomycetales bacterium]|nr:SsrA-binding protein SmpB [Planctomycetales bacterium]